jgi:hypothetical protein
MKNMNLFILNLSNSMNLFFIKQNKITRIFLSIYLTFNLKSDSKEIKSSVNLNILYNKP